MSSSQNFMSIGMMAGSAHEKYRDLQRGCCETWIKQCPMVYLFCGNHHEPDFEIEMVVMTSGKVKFIHLDTNEDYESAFYKQFLGLAWMMTNAPAQWYAIYGSDNYVIYDKVVETLKKVNIDGPVMVGGTIQHRFLDVQVPFNIGGGGIYLNHQAAEAILNIFEGDNYHSKALKLTESWFSLCERINRVDYKPACDLASGYYGWSIDIPIVGIRGFYPIDYQGTNKYNAYFSFNPDGIIVCHFMSRQQMLDYDLLRNRVKTNVMDLHQDLIDEATKEISSVVVIDSDSFPDKVVDVKNIYIKGKPDISFITKANCRGSNVIYMDSYKSLSSDLVFIDSARNYGSLKRLLESVHSYTSRILIHGTVLDGNVSDVIRLKKNIAVECKRLGLSISVIVRGILFAINQFIEEHVEWHIESTSDRGEGMTYLVKE